MPSAICCAKSHNTGTVKLGRSVGSFRHSNSDRRGASSVTCKTTETTHKTSKLAWSETQPMTALHKEKLLPPVVHPIEKSRTTWFRCLLLSSALSVLSKLSLPASRLHCAALRRTAWRYVRDLLSAWWSPPWESPPSPCSASPSIGTWWRLESESAKHKLSEDCELRLARSCLRELQENR